MQQGWFINSSFWVVAQFVWSQWAPSVFPQKENLCAGIWTVLVLCHPYVTKWECEKYSTLNTFNANIQIKHKHLYFDDGHMMQLIGSSKAALQTAWAIHDNLDTASTWKQSVFNEHMINYNS